MPEPTEVAAVLRRAADLIQQRGLAKGQTTGPKGELCALGATATAVGADPMLLDATADRRVLCEAADAALAKYLCAGMTPACPDLAVSDWSDARPNTATQVVAGLRAAAEEVLRG